MAEIERINTLHYADAKLFLNELRKLKRENDHIYFRGQASADWSLLPTACRGNGYEWTRKWIESFVEANQYQYKRFLETNRWENETEEKFKVRFELALRDYIEKEILYQFQQFAIQRDLIDLSSAERVDAADQDQILDYLKRDETPLAGQIRYASLLAQHHGVPTRLLDWTSRLDVAIDFAARGLTDPKSVEGRIVVWAIRQWGRNVSNADPDCDEQLYVAVIIQTGDGGNQFRIETPLKGTCLKMFLPLDRTLNRNVHVTPHHLQAGQDNLPGRQTYQLRVDDVHEVYIKEQKGKATIDMWHDRNRYRNGSCQSIDARMSASHIPKDRVYKFTLPYSEIPYLLPLLKQPSVTQIYSLPIYEQFDDADTPSGVYFYILANRHKL